MSVVLKQEKYHHLRRSNGRRKKYFRNYRGPSLSGTRPHTKFIDFVNRLPDCIIITCCPSFPLFDSKKT